MEDHHRDVIQDNWTYLLEKVILEAGLTDHLHQNHVLSQDMLDMIDAKPIRRKKCQEFFNILVRRGPDAFNKFIEALNKTDQKFIADKLLKDLNDKESQLC